MRVSLKVNFATLQSTASRTYWVWCELATVVLAAPHIWTLLPAALSQPNSVAMETSSQPSGLPSVALVSKQLSFES